MVKMFIDKLEEEEVLNTVNKQYNKLGQKIIGISPTLLEIKNIIEDSLNLSLIKLLIFEKLSQST